MGELQYWISLWYYQQKRYGVAIATALEAVRSLLHPFLPTAKDINQEKERILVENRLKYIKKYNKELPISEKDKEVCDFFCELCDAMVQAKEIRNIFAHNLNDGGNQNKKAKNFVENNEIIENYFECMKKLYAMIHSEKNEVRLRKVFSVSKSNVSKSNIAAKIILSNESVPRNIIEKQKKSNTKTYKVYTLDEKSANLLSKDSVAKTARIKKNLEMILTYIDENVEAENPNICFYNLNLRQIINYSTALYKKGFQSIKLINKKGEDESVPKILEELLEL